MRALVVEDEPELADLIAAEVGSEGFAVDTVASAAGARAALHDGLYALVVLDRRLPDGDGIALVPTVRSKQSEAAVLVVSAMGDVPDRVAGLDAGADDYMAKPFHADELRARIRASIRRPSAGRLPPVRCGALEYDQATRQVAVAGQPMLLRRREAALLGALMRRARRVVQRETLLREVYGYGDEPSANTFEAHMSRLRRRLDEAGAGVVLHAVRGIGYMIDGA
jgi:two-component system OmpR family response regulator